MTSRDQARAAGEKWFEGKPCRTDGTTERSVATGSCRACRNAAVRAYRDRNVEKTRAALYAWRENNREAVAEIQRNYRIRSGKTSTASVKQWRKNNPEKQKEATKRQYLANPAYYAEAARKRKNLLAVANVFPHEREAISQFYKDCPEGMTVDHDIPLKHPKVCGLHCIANLGYLTQSENSKKGNRFVSEEHS